MNEKSLIGRKLYIPQMSYEGSACMAAAFQSVGIDASPSPEGDEQTYELAHKYLSGDECLPESVTLGNFLKITRQENYDPHKTAFLMPTSDGPCRFGHYLPLAKKIFNDIGEREVLFVYPTSSNGYEGIGADAGNLVRTGWHAVVASDILRKMLLINRPYEINKGETDKVFADSLDQVCKALAMQNISQKERIGYIVDALTKSRDAFRAIKKDKSSKRLLIGIVGEIFCRLNDFSNDSLIRLVEKYGGEAWMSDISEWVWYTNDEEEKRLIRYGKRFSFQMLGSKLKYTVMKYDEHKLLEPFKDDFKGYEEPQHITEVLEKSRPYLPREGSHGEMVISLGRSIYYQEKGAAGVIDISPFTCMNGIICEAVYPRVSRELDDFPMRVFYFDGIQASLESDIEIFMELARNYAEKRNNGR